MNKRKIDKMTLKTEPKPAAYDGCCGGGIGDIPYSNCTDCPRRPKPVIQNSHYTSLAHGLRSYGATQEQIDDVIAKDMAGDRAAIVDLARRLIT